GQGQGDRQGDQERRVQEGSGADPGGPGPGPVAFDRRAPGGYQAPEGQGLRDRAPVRQLPLVMETHMATGPRSSELLRRASEIIPGGVNSPVRAFRGVGGEPFFVSHAKGSRIWDVDGNEYIDYVLSWGPLILGHAHPAVIEAVNRAAQSGTSFGAPTELEVELAETVRRFFPSMEMLRFVSSGTEATM